MYRHSPGLLLGEIVGFMVPDWMLNKMKAQMQSLRTDLPKPGRAKTVGGVAVVGRTPAPHPISGLVRHNLLLRCAEREHSFSDNLFLLLMDAYIMLLMVLHL